MGEIRPKTCKGVGITFKARHRRGERAEAAVRSVVQRAQGSLRPVHAHSLRQEVTVRDCRHAELAPQLQQEEDGEVGRDTAPGVVAHCTGARADEVRGAHRADGP